MKSPKQRHAPTRYKVGQEIVYPLQGVGHIRAIEERPFREKKLLYYIVYLEVSDMTIMVPTNKADDLGIRPIVGKKESQKALRLIAEEYEPVTADWKLRYQMNLDLLKKGSVLDIANVVRALYHRSRVKELPILERKLYDSALKLLIDEISFSLGKSKDDVEELIFDKLKLNVK
jgi:CarD family transcriptional regulator